MPGQYLKVGVEELDRDKLPPLLKLKYNNGITDAVMDLGRPMQIMGVFEGFRDFILRAAAIAGRI